MMMDVLGRTYVPVTSRVLLWFESDTVPVSCCLIVNAGAEMQGSVQRCQLPSG